MKSYQEKKDAAREKAIEIQLYLSSAAVSYDELAEIQSYLEKTGRRYGLIKEFEENGLL